METEQMGRVLTTAKIENAGDLWSVRQGHSTDETVRRITVDDALVDTGATTLALPTRYIQQLGLAKAYEKQATSYRGVGPVSVYDAIRLTLLGDRFCTIDVIEVPDDVPVLIGQTPLGMLDLVVDLQGQRLTGNPAHNGEQVLELY